MDPLLIGLIIACGIIVLVVMGLRGGSSGFRGVPARRDRVASDDFVGRSLFDPAAGASLPSDWPTIPHHGHQAHGHGAQGADGHHGLHGHHGHGHDLSHHGHSGPGGQDASHHDHTGDFGSGHDGGGQAGTDVGSGQGDQ